jgi:epsilon-lactone hydrolase
VPSIPALVSASAPALHVTPYNPHDTTVLLIDGGGYVAGSAFGYRHFAGAIAVTGQTPVLDPYYRLAPEHPFPTAIEDVMNAHLWLLDTASARASAGSSWEIRRRPAPC